MNSSYRCNVCHTFVRRSPGDPTQCPICFQGFMVEVERISIPGVRRHNSHSANLRRRIPTIKINSEHLADNSLCTICHDPFEIGRKVKELPCNHIYHRHCILPWLARHNSCPICRRSVLGEENRESERSIPDDNPVWRGNNRDRNNNNWARRNHRQRRRANRNEDTGYQIISWLDFCVNPAAVLILLLVGVLYIIFWQKWLILFGFTSKLGNNSIFDMAI